MNVDNVHKHRNYINIRSSQNFGTYLHIFYYLQGKHTAYVTVYHLMKAWETRNL
jgi:hypothetical protein